MYKIADFCPRINSKFAIWAGDQITLHMLNRYPTVYRARFYQTP